MNIYEFAGVDNWFRLPDGTELTHGEVYRIAVGKLGGANRFLNLLPVDLEQIKEHLASGDAYLNKIPLKFWDRMAIYVDDILAHEGVNSTISQQVSLLKEAAVMLALEKRNDHE